MTPSSLLFTTPWFTRSSCAAAAAVTVVVKLMLALRPAHASDVSRQSDRLSSTMLPQTARSVITDHILVVRVDQSIVCESVSGHMIRVLNTCFSMGAIDIAPQGGPKNGPQTHDHSSDKS